MSAAAPILVNVVKGAAAPLPVDNATLLMSTAASGTDTAIVQVANVAAAQAEFGQQGPLQELAALYLARSRRPLYCMRINDSTPGSAGSVTAVRVNSGTPSTGTMATTGSVPVDSYDVVVEVMATGTVAANSAVIRVSFDGGVTWYAERQIAASIAFADFGVTLVFADAGGGPVYFEEGDLFTFATLGPAFSTADLQAALDAWIASNIRVRRIHVMGLSSTTLHAAIATRMATAEGVYKNARVIEETDDQGSGESVTTWQAGVLGDYNLETERQMVVPGWVEVLNPISGFQLRRPFAWLVGPRAAAIDISQDVGWVDLGSLAGAVVSDEYPIPQDGTLYPALDGRGYCYPMSRIGRSGVYASGGFMRVSSGDPYYRLATCQVLDEAIDQCVNQLMPYINADILANADGTILESEAAAIDARLNRALRETLVDVSPKRISPADDGVYATVSRDNNIVSTRTLIVTVTLTPKAYLSAITLNIGFALSS